MRKFLNTLGLIGAYSSVLDSRIGSGCKVIYKKPDPKFKKKKKLKAIAKNSKRKNRRKK